MCAVYCTGDWHVAYILLYGPTRLEIVEEEEENSEAAKKPEDSSKPEPMDTDKSTDT